MSTEELLIYTAGFFDADGTVGIYWHKDQKCIRGGLFYVQTQICQKIWMPIFEEWHQHWGGYLGKQAEMWMWKLYGHVAGSFLLDILPYLRKKQDQAGLAIKFWQRAKSQKGQPVSDAEFEWQGVASEVLKEMKNLSEPAPSELLRQIERQLMELGTQLEIWPTGNLH